MCVIHGCEHIYQTNTLIQFEEYILNTRQFVVPTLYPGHINQTESITRYGGGIISEYKMNAPQSAEILIQVL